MEIKTESVSTVEALKSDSCFIEHYIIYMFG